METCTPPKMPVNNRMSLLIAPSIPGSTFVALLGKEAIEGVVVDLNAPWLWEGNRRRGCGIGLFLATRPRNIATLVGNIKDDSCSCHWVLLTAILAVSDSALTGSE